MTFDEALASVKSELDVWLTQQRPQPDGWSDWEPLPPTMSVAVRGLYEGGGIIEIQVESWGNINRTLQ